MDPAPIEEEFSTRKDMHLPRKIHHCLHGLFFVGCHALLPWHVSVLFTFTQFMVVLAFEHVRVRVGVVNRIAMKLLGSVMRETEKGRIVAAVPYILGCLLAEIAYRRIVSMLSIAYLAIGDPVASVTGLLYGQHGRQLRPGRSWIGTCCGGGACALATIVLLWLNDGSTDQWGLMQQGGVWGLVVLGVLGGVAGAIAEVALPTTWLDDNVVIPVASGLLLTPLFGFWEVPSE